jgi:c-di-GMP-binding flagellar brake protein YcgR
MLADEWETPRRWARYKIDVRVKIITRRNGVGTATYGRGTDISEGGMSAYLSMEIGVGKTVEMELTLPYSQQSLKVNGIVRNRRGFCYGLEFTNLAAPEREQILRACKALSLVQ